MSARPRSPSASGPTPPGPAPGASTCPGHLTVRALPDHQVELAGPAVLVADGQTDLLTGA
ncbi:hypothetical protein [Janibacter melonis]|uniref:hypothetical protein n=1 Tax=Janibacter melonis TaxID=262209 RepID=UPI0035567146